MEKLKRADPPAHPNQGGGEINCSGCDIYDIGFRDIIPKQEPAQEYGDILEVMMIDLIEKFLRERRNLFGHIKSSVSRKAIEDGFSKVDP